MIANDVIKKARYMLSDENCSRWSDDRLLSLLNDAIDDLTLTTRLYSEKGWLRLQEGVAVYNVDDEVLRFDRVEHLNRPLSMMSFENMDERYGDNWQEDTGEEMLHIVHNHKKGGEFRIYPIPTIGGNDYITSNSSYGIITGFSYKNIEATVVGDYGSIVSPVPEEWLTLYYTSLPTHVETVTDELDDVIDRYTIPVLAHYVQGAALRDNMEARDRQVGNEELSLYETKKMQLKDEKTINSAHTVRTTKYNPMG